MQVVVLALVAMLMWTQGVVNSVRIVDLRVAAHMTEGSTGLLGCNFDLGDEALYSLKWYKDDREFFRYVPKAQPPMKSFFVPGVMVDLNRSSVNVVALKRLSRESGGEYQCEVKAEAPTFTMVTQHKRVVVDRIHLGAERPATKIVDLTGPAKSRDLLRLRSHEPLSDYTKLPNIFGFKQIHTSKPYYNRAKLPKTSGIRKCLKQEPILAHAKIPKLSQNFLHGNQFLIAQEYQKLEIFHSLNQASRPSFQKQLRLFLPEWGPHIIGLQDEYHVGSQVTLNCTTAPSRPESQLKWLINGLEAPQNCVYGPFLLIPTNHPFTYQAKLLLNFTVEAGHFDETGAMTLKCQATIPPLYHQEKEYTFYEPVFQATTELVSTDNVAPTDIPKILLILQVLLMFLVNLV